MDLLDTIQRALQDLIGDTRDVPDEVYEGLEQAKQGKTAPLPFDLEEDLSE